MPPINIMSAASLSANHNFLNHQSINQNSLLHNASSNSLNSASNYLHHQTNGQSNDHLHQNTANSQSTTNLAHVQNLSDQLINQGLTSSLSNNSLSSNNNTNNAIKTSHSYFNSNNNNNNNNGTSMQDIQVDRPIGFGAFGVVWAVTDPRDGKRVALKKMPNVFQNLVSAKRVYREVKMLCFFHHENIVSALDLLQPPHIDFFQEIYVITELLQSDLHKIIVSNQPLTPDHVKIFLYQILRGLKYLHSANIIHRDLK